MTNKKFSFLLFFCTLSFALIKLAYCVDEDQTWNLMDLDDQLATALGIGTFGAGLLIAGVLIFMFLLPLGYLYSGKNKNPTMPCVIMGNVLLGFCVYMTWFPVWLFAVEILMIAGIWALNFKGVI